MKRLENKIILIADDEVFVRDTIAELLELQGAHVLRASDGMEAWKLIRDPANKVDAIVSDFKMPVITGFELLQLVRQAQFTLPFIFITGFAGESHESLVEAGAFAVLTKPFKLEQLMKTLETAWQKLNPV